MWQRFTQMAREAVYHAQEEAQSYGTASVSSEHLLLGVLRDEKNVASKVLHLLGFSGEVIRQETRRQLASRPGTPETPTEFRLSSRAKRILEFGLDEARALGNDFIGTEHILLGIVRDRESLAGQSLEMMGIELESARRATSAIQIDPNLELGPILPVKPLNEPYPWESYDKESQRILFETNDKAQTCEGADFDPLHLLHLLHSLIKPSDSSVGAVLSQLGVNPRHIRLEIEGRRGWRQSGPDLFLSPIGKRMIEFATREARAMRSDKLGPYHLILGVVQADSASSGALLQKFGVTLLKLREAVRNLNSNSP